MVEELDFEPDKKKGVEDQVERNRIRARNRYRDDPLVQIKVKQRALERKRELRKEPEFRTRENTKRAERRQRAKQRASIKKQS